MHLQFSAGLILFSTLQTNSLSHSANVERIQLLDSWGHESSMDEEHTAGLCSITL